MPKFECDTCGEKFSSKEKRNIHKKKKHDDEDSQRNNDPFITRKKIGAIVVAFFMIGLPLGGAVFYANLSPERAQNDFVRDPPVGLQRTVEEGEVPETYVLEEPMSKEQQVYLLTDGGTKRVGDFYPSVILQHSCENCSEEVEKMTQVAEDFNQNYRFVYVAPYPDMEYNFTLSGFQQLTTYDDFEKESVKNDICRKLGNEPVTCIEGVFEQDENRTEQE